MHSPPRIDLFFMAGGGLLLVLAFFVGWSGWRTRRWPSTRGWIQSSSVVERQENDRDRDGWQRTRVTYSAHVIYEYAVGGRSYTGTSIGATAVQNSSRLKAEVAAGRYRAGDPVNVFYDPNKPSDAVLVPGVQPGPVFGLGFMAVVVFVAGLMLGPPAPPPPVGRPPEPPSPEEEAPEPSEPCLPYARSSFEVLAEARDVTHRGLAARPDYDKDQVNRTYDQLVNAATAHQLGKTGVERLACTVKESQQSLSPNSPKLAADVYAEAQRLLAESAGP